MAQFNVGDGVRYGVLRVIQKRVGLLDWLLPAEPTQKRVILWLGRFLLYVPMYGPYFLLAGQSITVWA